MRSISALAALALLFSPTLRPVAQERPDLVPPDSEPGIESCLRPIQPSTRCSQLTYDSQNFIGAGGTERIDGGMTDFGASIIDAMNEAGMLIDVSHCGDRTTLDAIELSPKPIAITHSNCRALNDHRRLKTDETIRKLARKGGVMGITGVRMFVRDHEPTTVEHMVDHIDHVVKLGVLQPRTFGVSMDDRF
jgi:membrane dipeptidase